MGNPLTVTRLVLAIVLATLVSNAIASAPLVDAAGEEYTRWTAKASMPTGRYGVAAAASNGKVYAIGGESLNFVIHDQVEQNDPTTDSRTAAAPLSVASTEVAVTTGIDGKIAFSSGRDGDNEIYVIRGWDRSDAHHHRPRK